MKNVFLALVLVFLFSSTTALYAQIKEEDVYLNEISDFYLVDQKMVSDEGSTLVPKGVIRGVNDVYYVDFEYEVVVKKGMDLQVLIDDILFTNELVSYEDLEQTFDFEISKRIVEDVKTSDHLFGSNEEAERVIVTVSVSMNEPNRVELMQQLIGGQLNFEVYFFAATVTA